MWRANSQPRLHLQIVPTTNANFVLTENVGHLNGRPRPYSAAMRKQPRQLVVAGPVAKKQPLVRPKSAMAINEGHPLISSYGPRVSTCGNQSNAMGSATSFPGHQNLNHSASTTTSFLDFKRFANKNNSKGGASRRKPLNGSSLLQPQNRSFSAGPRRHEPNLKIGNSSASRPPTMRPTKLGLGDKYKSTVLELQVKLAEKIHKLQEHAHPHAVGPNDMLSAYSDIFDEVLCYDNAFAPILENIKEGYHRILATSTDYQAARVRRHCIRAVKPTVTIPLLDMGKVCKEFHDYDDEDEEEEYEEEFEEEYEEEDEDTYTNNENHDNGEFEAESYEEEESYSSSER